MSSFPNCFALKTTKQNGVYLIDMQLGKYLAPEYRKFKPGDMVVVPDRQVWFYRFKRYRDMRNVTIPYTHAQHMMHYQPEGKAVTA